MKKIQIKKTTVFYFKKNQDSKVKPGRPTSTIEDPTTAGDPTSWTVTFTI